VRWRLLVVGAFVNAVVAAAGLRWRMAEREAALREDLAEVVTVEERARLFGLRETISDILAPQVPDEWREAYEATFSAGEEEAEPVALAVETVSLLDERNALITVRLDGQAQLRHYRLGDGGWRRAPIDDEVWGATNVHMLRNGVVVVYSERDRRFAQAVIEALPALFEELQRLGGSVEIKVIEFRPTELGPVLMEDSPTLILNSPQLIAPENALDGAEAVRYALAKELLSRTGMSRNEGRALSGGRLFRAAAREVTALRWALADESLERIAAAWRAQIGDTWRSPLFASRFNNRLELADATATEAAMLWMVNYLYEAERAGAVARIFRGVPGAETWDDIFEAALGPNTLDVEVEVASAVGAYDPTVSRAPGRMDRVSGLAFPLTALTVASDLPEERMLTVQVAGLPLPVAVDASAAEIILPDGSSLPGDCAPLFRETQIEGAWIEEGRRVEAARLTVRNVAPATLPQTQAPPADTRAYVFAFESFIRDSEPAISSLFSLDDGGEVAPLAGLQGSQPLNLFQPGPQQASFLLEQSLDGCPRRWLMLYEPSQGITGSWLAPAEPYAEPPWSVLWGQTGARGTDEILLLLQPSRARRARSGASHPSYIRLRKAGPTVVEPEGTLPPGAPIVWRPEQDQLIMVGWDEPHEIKFIDLASGAVVASHATAPGLDAWSAQLINGGAELLYIVSYPRAGGVQQSALRKLDLATGEDTVLLEPEAGHIFYTFVASRASPTRHVGLIVGAPYSSGVFPPTHLLIADVTAPDEDPSEIRFAEEESVISLLPCSDGSFLFTVVVTEEGRERPEESRIRLWRPGGEIATLYQADGWVYPWACR
ncbi:MAG: hypothetical protein ACRDIB_13760, partial [Ardenticatenaceae bacterium]